MKIENVHKEILPEEYLLFLEQHPEGTEVQFNPYEGNDPDGISYTLFGEEKLLRGWTMNGVGTAKNFECLKLYVACMREFVEDDYTDSNVGDIALKRVEAGFVIGEENGDYLYLDSQDNYSVWIYHHDGGDVLRVANTFGAFLKG